VGVSRPVLRAPNHEWSLDFVHDALGTGRSVRVLSVVDNFTRECLALEVDSGFASQRVTRVLDSVIAQRGAPKALRMDNGLNASDFLKASRHVSCRSPSATASQQSAAAIPVIFHVKREPAKHSKHKIGSKPSSQDLKQRGNPVEGPSIIYEVKMPQRPV
jgi:transposase InsO family protein